MRITIEEGDFRRLSLRTQQELIEVMSGRSSIAAKSERKLSAHHWREPVDLTPDMAAKLIHGLADNHRRRLELFARHGARVSMKKLLAVTKDTDLRVLSYFQGAVNRKVRRLLDDPEKKLHLFGWDYDATRWDKSHTKIVDGIYYVSDKTCATLKSQFS